MWSAQKNVSNILSSIFVSNNTELFTRCSQEINNNFQENNLFANKVLSSFLLRLKSKSILSHQNPNRQIIGDNRFPPI